MTITTLPIQEFFDSGLSTRLIYCIKRLSYYDHVLCKYISYRIDNTDDLLKISFNDFLRTPNLGKVTLSELKKSMYQLGYTIGETHFLKETYTFPRQDIVIKRLIEATSDIKKTTAEIRKIIKSATDKYPQHITNEQINQISRLYSKLIKDVRLIPYYTNTINN